MGVAQRPGGLYYFGGVARDAAGNTIKDAPELGPDTIAPPPGSVSAVAGLAAAFAPGPTDEAIAAMVATRVQAALDANATAMDAMVEERVQAALAKLTDPAPAPSK